MKQIIDILNDNGNKVDFDESLTVKMSPHQWPEKIISVQTDSVSLFYKTRDHDYLFVSEKNIPVINSIRQRLLWMKHEKKIK